MTQQTLSVRAITRPGRVLCLVCGERTNWTKAVQLLISIPGGRWAYMIPVSMSGDVPRMFQSLLETAKPDYIVTIGPVPREFVQELLRQKRMPNWTALDETDTRIKSWQQSASIMTAGDGAGVFDGAFLRVRAQGSSALPIPMTAVSGEIPTLQTTVVTSIADGTDRRSVFDLRQILQYYSRHLDIDDTGTLPVWDERQLAAEDYYVFIGTGDDVQDLFVYWNIRRAMVLRSRCIWLPRSLFEEPSVTACLEILHEWFITPESLFGGHRNPSHQPPRMVHFITAEQGWTQALARQGVSGWQHLDAAAPTESTEIVWSLMPVGIALTHPDTRFGEYDHILASVQGEQWSLTLPVAPSHAGSHPVTEVQYQGFASQPMEAFSIWNSTGVRVSDQGLVIYRATQPSVKSETVVFDTLSDFQVLTSILKHRVSESDKAGSVLALIRQVGGLERCSLFEDPKVFNFIEEASLESVHRSLKGELMSLIRADKPPDDIESHVDGIIRTLGDEIRRHRKPWFAPNQLAKKLGAVNIELLLKAGLLENGFKLSCPECRSSGFYSPETLADFRCFACGWRGRAPLRGNETPLLLSLRELVTTVVQTGGLPVILTLLRIHRGNTGVRSFPGLLLPFHDGTKDADIVAWNSGCLEFYEVKHNAIRAMDEALTFIDFCQTFDARPCFAAFEGTRELEKYLNRAGVRGYSVVMLQRPRYGSIAPR